MHLTQRILCGAVLLLLLAGTATPALAQQPTLELQGTYETNIFDEGAAEIAAYDTNTGYVFFVNADANEVVALDISDPSNPTDVYTINVETQVTGGSANSVDVYDGTVAVAVEGANTTDNGFAVFYDATDGSFISRAQVGIMPDNLSFNGDGTAVVTANEGEPVDDYSTDPEGTVSVVDVSDITTPSVATAGFTAFNSQRAQLIGEGVRIFGNAGRTELDVTT